MCKPMRLGTKRFTELQDVHFMLGGSRERGGREGGDERGETGYARDWQCQFGT